MSSSRLLRLAVAAALVPVVASAAIFHLALKRAEPASGATLTASPSAIRLWFTQRAELAVTTVSLRGAAGPVALGAVTRGSEADAPVVAPVPSALVAGRYTVEWRTTSRDGHPVRGTYAFVVK